MIKAKKIYPSSSGFQVGQFYEVEYNSACYRFQVAALGTPRRQINPIYEKIGAVHEAWYEITNQGEIEAAEVPIVKDYENNVVYSGRVDFLMKNGEIHETKASLSKSFLYSVVRKRKFKLSHLAQLVSYLIHYAKDTGKIIAGYYAQPVPGEFVLKEFVEFAVKIENGGVITVDGKPSGHTVEQALSYLYSLVKHLTDETIGSRPVALDNWSSPCRTCPLAELCDRFDRGRISEQEYKNEAKIKLTELANDSTNAKV